MPDLQTLSRLARLADVNFTGFLGHDDVVRLAEAWMPDVNFHEDERFHSIDLADLYTLPPPLFEAMNAVEQQEFGIEADGVLRTPPALRNGEGAARFGRDVMGALAEPEFDLGAVYTHGASLRRSERFFGSETPLPGPGNPAQPRHPLRARAEFRMLLETLKADLALRALDGDDAVESGTVDAIWGDFDVTDLLLRRVAADGSVIGPAPRDLRRDYARALIADFEAGDRAALARRLDNPPPGTAVDRTVWLALSGCGLMEYHFVYAYNDFPRYGGFFTNEHEGDNEGCALVFDREDLEDLQRGALPPEEVAPMGLITAAHEPEDRADERRSVDRDPGDARDGLDVYVARGSHATYLTPGTHDFFNVGNLVRKKPELTFLLALLSPGLLVTVLAVLQIYEHFDPDPDETSGDGVTGKGAVEPGADPETHRQMALVVSALSALPDQSLYGPDRIAEDPAALAVRAFRGTLGGHDSAVDKSPRWSNKTRRYFVQLVAALRSGEFRAPRRPVIVE